MDEMDADVLITLIQSRPVLWDKTLDVYKDRIATRNAWREVCLELKPNFDSMEEKDKNAFGKEIIRRWTNLRDSFVKSKIKMKAQKKSGSEAKKIKKYVFSDQLQFLNKLYDPRETVDSIQSGIDGGLENIVEEDREKQVSNEDCEDNSNSYKTNTTPKIVSQTRSRKHKKPDEVELRLLKALEDQKPCSKMAFLHSLKPHLDTFDEHDYLQFQMGVLKVIESIKERKQKKIAHPPPFSQHSAPTPSHHQFQTYIPPARHNSALSESQQLFNPRLLISSQQHFRPSSQISISDQPTLYSSRRWGTEHQAPSPNQTPSTSSKQDLQSTARYFQQFGDCLTPESDNICSPGTNSAESSVADNIDFCSQ